MKNQEVKTPNLVKSLSDARSATPMKSLQFRSIAPKVPPPPPPDAPNPSGGPLLVPTQNYALMQVAGREGTFSLVPLPASASASASSSASPRQQPISKSLKLPIPRYQPMRSKSTPEKAGNSKSGSPAKVAMTPARSSALTVQSKASEVANTPTEPANEPLVLAGEAGLEGRSGPSLGTLAPKLSAVAMATPEMTPPTCQVTPEKAAQPITVLSPTLFGKAVQLITPSPSGKLPILPYSRVRDSLLANTPPVPPPPPPPAPLSNQNTSPTTQTTPPPPTQPSAKRKRGRRRKTPEDVLALEARRKRALTFFRRRAAPEKPLPSTSTPATPGSRKYRSIRPKPAPGVVSSSSPPNPTLQLTSPTSPTSSTSSQASVSLPLHPCPTCGRCFQHKHHLTSHMTTHLLMTSHSKAATTTAPLPDPDLDFDPEQGLERGARTVRVPRSRALARARPRPRPSLRCVFCQKAFSYVGVFFSHLRELHHVILTVEPSIAQHEEHTPGTESREEDMEDPVELQIKCGRCQAVTPTFSDMQLHLLYVHGQSVGPGPSGGGPSPSSGSGGGDGRSMEEELVKHAAHYWRQLNERRALRRCGRCQEVFLSVSRLKRHVCGRRHQGALPLSSSVGLRTGRGIHCFLCSIVLDTKQEVLEHWRGRHYCENPALLWEALNGDGETVANRSIS